MPPTIFEILLFFFCLFYFGNLLVMIVVTFANYVTSDPWDDPIIERSDWLKAINPFSIFVALYKSITWKQKN